ncbi:MAG: response regulator, partial [Planctomycetota bacterium]|nr:response regulator [Planctomycetota bacterium]
MRMPTILVVEDEPASLEGMVTFLEEVGYEVATATNGEEGLQEAERVNPDLILSDIQMPVMDGMELLEKLCEKRSESSFIITTGVGTIRSAVQAMLLGAENYLTKPIDFDELQVVLNR